MNLIPEFHNNLTGAESPIQPLFAKAGFAQTFLYRIHRNVIWCFLRNESSSNGTSQQFSFTFACFSYRFFVLCLGLRL
ncbi:hypothetical protein D1609_06710 [Leptospira borgpetersenii serovar Hardjo-bovis]|nr:hypothetical protein B9T54_06790 [Leptospira borgpetersenii serovar Hardjo-bovis]AYR08232.1 hypothetical protein D1609_06710 [Leptospira borgpetersenii serovar Hardjo-bovis]TQE53582.1 hypothetical protein FFZ95_06980 [Leptospira borgpetersenii]TQE57469.1 hypothetical protein FFZ96_06840 [Leptospira borgpetersenii]